MLERCSNLTSILGTPRVDDFRAWLRIARRGERVVYYQGFLVVDRGTSSPLRERERRRLDALAAAAAGAAAAGLVHLVQSRCGAGSFVYLAVKTRALPDRGLGRSELPQLKASQPVNGAPPDQPEPTEQTAYREGRSRHFASPLGM